MVRTVIVAPCVSFKVIAVSRRVQIVGVDYCFNTFTNEVAGLGIEFYLGGVGDLFD